MDTGEAETMIEARRLNPRNHRWLKAHRTAQSSATTATFPHTLDWTPAAAMGARPTALGKNTCIAIEGCRRTACVGALMTHTDHYPMLWPHCAT